MTSQNQQYLKDNTKIKASDDEFMSMKEVAQLRKEITKIREENEILKKVMAIFAKERKINKSC
ncbi:MAG: hypothetical protein ACRCWG_01075 [Sarcina sp.]